MGNEFLDVTSLADWSLGETSIVAVLLLIGIMTIRSVMERERALTFGKDTESRRTSYEERWRSGRMTGA